MTPEDMQQIRSIIVEEVRPIVAEEVKTVIDHEVRLIVKEVVSIELQPIRVDISELKSDFRYLNQKIDQNHRQVLNKIDDVITMQSEDMSVVYKDIKSLKNRVSVLEKGAA